MGDTLRARQMAQVRQSILDALAAIVAEEGVFGLSFPAIADRAGVSTRTVYNYFPSRQDLIEGLAEHLGEAMGDDIEQMSHRLDDLSDLMYRSFRLFGEFRRQASALAALDKAGVVRSRAHDERTIAFREQAALDVPELSGRDGDAFTALLRAIAAVDMWRTLTDELGLTDDEAAGVCGWALATLVEAARRDGTAMAPPPKDDVETLHDRRSA